MSKKDDNPILYAIPSDRKITKAELMGITGILLYSLFHL